VAVQRPVSVKLWATLIQALGARPIRSVPRPDCSREQRLQTIQSSGGSLSRALDGPRLKNLISDTMYDVSPLEVVVADFTEVDPWGE
jgi:hypothetical protein